MAIVIWTSIDDNSRKSILLNGCGMAMTSTTIMTTTIIE
jgi:hypothetical protein